MSVGQTSVELATNLNADTLIKTVAFNELEGTFYASEDPSLKVSFEALYDYKSTLMEKPQISYQIEIFYLKTLNAEITQLH